ncbi:MAG: SUMF1/EgtB/PvdO family nonheme iron enzyme [Candidatus Poseidoniaceae archaeon]|jgi:hypothetical protein|nr:SUMF1/EgtB/PvdO family nonheme iron enzyme [Candidatus Poseidoniaceae archaeon]
METVEGQFGLEFIQIPAGEVLLGTNKGGWIHASERPRHQVNLPSYLIMKNPLTKAQVATIMGEESNDNSSYEGMDLDTLQSVCNILSKHFDDEVRAPSESEWVHAENEIQLSAGLTEFLADEATGNHRGARMDGRPRDGDLLGPMAGHRVAFATHPKNKDVKVRYSTPADRSLPKVVTRLVVSPKRSGDDIRVPDTADLGANIRSEILWTTLLGIIPSFTIPIFRGFSSYAVDGWTNLLFGGLCAGFVTGAFWRPKRATWFVEDGELTRRR